jgi:hypothetical protein
MLQSLHPKNEHARAGPCLDAIMGGGGGYSYVHVHIPQKRSLLKDIRQAEHVYINMNPSPNYSV